MAHFGLKKHIDMSTKMRGVVGRELGWQQLGSSWETVSSIPTVFQLGTYQSLTPSSATSHHISRELPMFGSHGCSFLTKRSSQVVKLIEDGEVVMTSLFHCSLELIAPRQATTPLYTLKILAFRTAECLAVLLGVNDPLLEAFSIYQIGGQPGHQSEEHVFVFKLIVAKYRAENKVLVIQTSDTSKYF